MPVEVFVQARPKFPTGGASAALRTRNTTIPNLRATAEVEVSVLVGGLAAGADSPHSGHDQSSQCQDDEFCVSLQSIERHPSVVVDRGDGL